MSDFLQKRDAFISPAGRKLDAALAKLGITEKPAGRRQGHLLFALDLTSSREASLQRARIATAAMFAAIKAIGSVAVKLAYYRGTHECRAGAWHDDPAKVSQVMQRLSCEGGTTQIGRILRLALAETEGLDGVVFIGDHCEEDTTQLKALAEKLGKSSIPLFIFHECTDSDARSLEDKPIFKCLAELSGGVYCEFKPSSGAVLREMLASIAAFTSAGKDGVAHLRPALTSEARHLQKRLLLLPGPEGPRPGDERNSNGRKNQG